MSYKRKLMEYVAQQALVGRYDKPGVFHTEVQHDSWCKLLNGKGECNCDPIIRSLTHDA